MDHIRQELDELMGKDRNHPLHIRMKKRDHFDDSDVCKYNLVAFCPHDLFPNTKADLGKCAKRHDEFFKEMFNKDNFKDFF
jgi:RNA-binding protein Luc7-like 2